MSKQWTRVREEWVLSQWLSSVHGKNIGPAGDWTSDLLFPQCFQKLSVVDVLKRVSMEERATGCRKVSTVVFPYNLIFLIVISCMPCSLQGKQRNHQTSKQIVKQVNIWNIVENTYYQSVDQSINQSVNQCLFMLTLKNQGHFVSTFLVLRLSVC